MSLYNIGADALKENFRSAQAARAKNEKIVLTILGVIGAVIFLPPLLKK